MVDGGDRLGRAGRDQLELGRVGDNIAGREHAGDASVAIVILSTTIWLRCSSNPQVLSGPRSATKPIATISSSAGIEPLTALAVLERHARKPPVVSVVRLRRSRIPG